MARFSGQVFKLFESRFGGGSFRLENDQTYFNTRKPLPAFVLPGAWVEFEAGDIKGKGRSVDDTSLRPMQRDEPAKVGGGGGGQADRGTAIQYQSARKDALVMVGLLVGNGAVKLPENVAKRAGVIEALVDRFTAIYFEDTDSLGALSRSEPEELPAPEKAAKVKKDDDDGIPE